MKIEKIEHKNGFKVIHRVPDVTEEEREDIQQEILQKMYNDFIYYPKKHKRNSKASCHEDDMEI